MENNTKIFIIGNGGYQAWIRYMWFDALKTPDVSYFPEIYDAAANFFTKWLYRLGHAGKTRRFFRMILPRQWFQMVDFSRFTSPSEKIWFVFYFSGGVSSDLDYLTFLKQRYPLAKFILIATGTRKLYDNLFSSRAYSLSDILHFYDYAEFWDRPDAEALGVHPYHRIYALTCRVAAAQNSDLLFIGYCKDRLPELIRLYDFYESRGIDCLFIITGCPVAEQLPRRGIKYLKWLPYHMVVRYIAGCRCLLEVISNGMASSSLRLEESIAFRKRLLSNNVCIDKDHFFDSRNMKVINCNDDDITFIKGSFTDSDSHRSELSVSLALEDIANSMNGSRRHE